MGCIAYMLVARRFSLVQIIAAHACPVRRTGLWFVVIVFLDDRLQTPYQPADCAGVRGGDTGLDGPAASHARVLPDATD